jgi:hypothetical protein
VPPHLLGDRVPHHLGDHRIGQVAPLGRIAAAGDPVQQGERLAVAPGA